MGKSDLPLTSFQLANFGPTEKARFSRRSLRYAPVGMTIYLEIDDLLRQLSICNKIVIPTGA
jgi:hypothetical protein